MPQTPSRRSLFRSVPALVAMPFLQSEAAWPRTVATLSDEARAVCLEIRRLFDRNYQLVLTELNLEGSPEHEEAAAAAKAGEAQLDALTEVLLARPVRSLDEVVIIAELARAHAQWSIEKVPLYCSEKDACSSDEVTMGCLLRAVIELWGVGPLALPSPRST